MPAGFLPAIGASLSESRLDYLAISIATAAVTHLALLAWYVRRFGRVSNMEVHSPQTAVRDSSRAGWLAVAASIGVHGRGVEAIPRERATRAGRPGGRGRSCRAVLGGRITSIELLVAARSVRGNGCRRQRGGWFLRRNRCGHRRVSRRCRTGVEHVLALAADQRRLVVLDEVRHGHVGSAGGDVRSAAGRFVRVASEPTQRIISPGFKGHAAGHTSPSSPPR